MGRGLSDLQKTILCTALVNRQAEGLEPLRYCIEFDNQAERYEYDNPKSKAWRGIYQELGLTERGDHVCSKGGRHGVATALWREEHFDPAPLQAIVDRANARGVRARVVPGGADSLWHGDVYLWEILDSVYGFGGHRRIGVSGRIDPTRHHTAEELEAIRIEADEPAIGEWVEVVRAWTGMVEREQKNPGKRLPSGQFFAKSEIGAKRYEAARVTVSKAFERLAERGLAERLWWGKSPGLKLTLKGVEEAERLSATLGYVISESSQ